MTPMNGPFVRVAQTSPESVDQRLDSLRRLLQSGVLGPNRFLRIV